MAESHLEFEFAHNWEHYFPHIDLHSEHKFHSKRRYRFDFAHPEAKVGIEINGGTWSRGKMGHNSGSGLQRDYEKQCLAASEGWLVFPLNNEMLTNLTWLDVIAAAIQQRLASQQQPLTETKSCRSKKARK